MGKRIEKGIKIEEVKSERGLQGCTLSPLLFTLIMEELVQRVKKVGVGVPIDQDKLCILTFADCGKFFPQNFSSLKCE